MADLRLARPWNTVIQELDAKGISYEMSETRSPRDFFAVDEMIPYVVRVQEHGGSCVLTRSFAPVRSASGAGYEQGAYG